MTRLIDADKLKKCAIPCEIHNGALTELCVPLYQIDNAPTVEERPQGEITEEDIQNAIKAGYENGYSMAKAKYQRPQGEWEEPFEMNGKSYHKCNRCHVSSQLILIDNFCPHCGADMRGEKE